MTTVGPECELEQSAKGNGISSELQPVAICHQYYLVSRETVGCQDKGKRHLKTIRKTRKSETIGLVDRKIKRRTTKKMLLNNNRYQ